ncbi:hypothetical protein CHS0354_009897, partial [Potamilus streckersoni]
KFTDFPYSKSSVVPYKKKNYIDASEYLLDIRLWDMRIGAKFHPAYDHLMLLT